MPDSSFPLALSRLFGLDGKVAIVTGGSRGIGFMIASGLVANGVRTYITARKAESCEAAAAELSEHGGCVSIPADLSTADGLRVVRDCDHRARVADRPPRRQCRRRMGSTPRRVSRDRFDEVMDINVKDHITINSIAPGPFESKMMAHRLDDPDSRKMVEASVPRKRIGSPEDIAGTVIFLASRAGAFTTGTVIPVDDGISTL